VVVVVAVVAVVAVTLAVACFRLVPSASEGDPWRSGQQYQPEPRHFAWRSVVGAPESVVGVPESSDVAAARVVSLLAVEDFVVETQTLHAAQATVTHASAG
jgi:hypothetical protein